MGIDELMLLLSGLFAIGVLAFYVYSLLRPAKPYHTKLTSKLSETSYLVYGGDGGVPYDEYGRGVRIKSIDTKDDDSATITLMNGAVLSPVKLKNIEIKKTWGLVMGKVTALCNIDNNNRLYNWATPSELRSRYELSNIIKDKMAFEIEQKLAEDLESASQKLRPRPVTSVPVERSDEI